MAAKEVAKDKIICSEGQSLEAIHIIVSGSVNARFAGGNITLRKGDVVGLADIAFDSHSFTYTTLETSSFVSFPIKGKNSIANVVKVNPEVAKMMYTSMINQIILVFSSFVKSKEKCANIYKDIEDYYNEYRDICSHNNVIARSLPVTEGSEPFSLEDCELEDWIISYYSSIKDFPQEIKHSLASRSAFLNGFLLRASEDLHLAFSSCAEMNDYITDNASSFMQESRLDLFDLFTSLLYRLKAGTPDADKVTAEIEKIITIAKESICLSEAQINARVEEYKAKVANLCQPAASDSSTPVKVNEDLTGALDTILEYSGVSDEEANTFKGLLNKYKKLSDKASADDSARKLRLDITKLFYKIYIEAFQMSVRDLNLPVILKMFFNFGFVDAELLGAENSNYLYNLAKDFRGDDEKGVYTAYEWLTEVYHMRKEPSRNEFDMDYPAYLRDQKVQGHISATEESTLLNDPGERVLFELNNMFPMVNKVTYGRLTSFCPVLSEHDIIKPLQACLVNTETLTESFKKLEEVDYGAFYRETIYTNDECGIQREAISVRVLPDVILFPNIGTRGVMWQEIEGKKRTTPARYMVSVFHMEDLPTTLIRLTGEYRWEMCKRVQGARWNDVSERSLTSEYFDYVQFYRKNSELSSDAKEKVKAALGKAKNSFKEMFVRDYITWILFEGTGSPRLNKVARSIFVSYCPFPKALRTKVAANPLFKDLLERYDIKTSQKLHHFDNVITKIKGAGQEVPEELMKQRNFIEGDI